MLTKRLLASTGMLVCLLVAVLVMPTSAMAASTLTRVKRLEKTVATQKKQIASLQQRVASVEANVASLAARTAAVEANPTMKLSPYVSVVETPINGLNGPHIIFTGANLHVRSGSGSTGGNVNGRGNLIIGYNENVGLAETSRPGSHNLVVGTLNNFTSFGGLVAGSQNSVLAPYASIAGGSANTVTAVGCSILGGVSNTASQSCSTVSGGANNTATGYYSSVSAGSSNTASGTYSSVGGGQNRSAVGTKNWAAGALWQAN
jgi:cell division protein FtsB